MDPGEGWRLTSARFSWPIATSSQMASVRPTVASGRLPPSPSCSRSSRPSESTKPPLTRAANASGASSFSPFPA